MAKKQPVIDIKVDLKGKYFSPRSNVHSAIKAGLNDIASEMVGDVQEQLYPGHGWVTGRLRGSIGQRQMSSLTHEIRSGAITGDPVTYAHFIETGMRGGTKTSFRGYRMFEITASSWNQNHKRIDEILLSHALGELK